MRLGGSEFSRRQMLQLRKSVLCIQDRPAQISGPTFEALLYNRPITDWVARRMDCFSRGVVRHN